MSLSQRRLTQLSEDKFRDTIDALEHIGVVDADNPITCPLKVARSADIARAFFTRRMSRAVHLYDQSCFAADEIAEIWPDRHLPCEFEASELIAQLFPKPGFGGRRIGAKRSHATGFMDS